MDELLQHVCVYSYVFRLYGGHYKKQLNESSFCIWMDITVKGGALFVTQ